MRETLVHRVTTEAALPPRRWRRWTGGFLFGVLTLNACYSTRPLNRVPDPETRVVLDLTDSGRAEYGERIGPSVREVDGIVESATDSSYVIRINTVRYLDGQSDRWTGERFTFATRHVARARQREFSRGRTVGLGAAIAGALTTAILAVALNGSSSDGNRGNPRPVDGNQ